MQNPVRVPRVKFVRLGISLAPPRRCWLPILTLLVVSCAVQPIRAESGRSDHKTNSKGQPRLLSLAAYRDSTQGDRSAATRRLISPVDDAHLGGRANLTLSSSLAFQDKPAGHDPELEAKHPGHGSLGMKATDPTADLIQFQIQNSFVPSSFDSSGYSNSFVIQPVIPWRTHGGQLMITRPTIPIILSADPDGPINETSGLGDISLLHVFIHPTEWGNIAYGFNVVFPSATDERLGSGKWQAGPALAVIYKKIPKLQLGALLYNNWSFATNRSGKENVNEMFVQWVVNYHYKPGWYVGVGDEPWKFNWRNGKQNIPLSLRWGHITKIGKQPVNIFVQPFYTVAHDGPTAEWGVKLNVTLLFPEKKKRG